MRRAVVLRACVALSVALGLVFTVGMRPAAATVMVEVPLTDMIRDADAIVVGVVERSAVRLHLEDGHSEPRTTTTLRVREWLKGDGGSHVQLEELGGALPGGQDALVVVGTPTYAVGDEVIVFLRRCATCRRDVMRTYAMEQGRFHIQRGVPGVDDLVVRDTGALGFARWAEGEMEVDHGGRSAMRLGDFLGYVRATLDQLRVDGEHETVGGGR